MTTTTNTWDGVMEIAREAGARYPELVAAQWALESGWGKHTSGTHNYFGLKGEGSSAKTQEYVDGAPVEVVDGFLNFKDLEECVEYLVSRWYKDFKGFKGVNHASSRSAAARELQTQGYATNPGYADKLIQLMGQKASSGKAPAGPAQPKAEAKILVKIRATQDTVLKKEPKQASELAADQVKEVKKGQEYAVVAYKEVPAQGSAEVELGYGAGTWFIFEPHWRKEVMGGEAIPAVVDWSDFGCLVMPNLTVGEVLQFDKRRCPALGSSVIGRLMRTASEYQKVREAWGSGLGVTSFYRPEPINQQVGGVPGSKHTTGEAMDVYPTARSLEEFYQWIRRRWQGGLGDGRYRGFIHLDTAGGGFVPGAGAMPTRQWTY